MIFNFRNQCIFDNLYYLVYNRIRLLAQYILIYIKKPEFDYKLSNLNPNLTQLYFYSLVNTTIPFSLCIKIKLLSQYFTN